jgi:hypothetical protein
MALPSIFAHLRADASRGPSPLSFAAAMPCFSLAAAPGDPAPVVTRGKAVRPFIDTRKALDLFICVLLPAFGIFLHQNNVADKARNERTFFDGA